MGNPDKCQPTVSLSFMIYTLRVKIIPTEMCDDSFCENSPESRLKSHFS